MSVVRSLLAVRDAGYEPGGSRAELDLLDIVLRAGFPRPRQQYAVKIGSSRYRPDLVWLPPLKILAEYYGAPWHVGASAVAYDSQRTTAFAAAGWIPLVFTWESGEQEVIERTTAAFALRGFELPGRS